jgi:putative lipoic acid-binding regulatory protein
MTQPKHIGDEGSETKDTLLVFPTAFPIKAMGRMKATDADAANQNFAQTVLEIVQKHAPDFDAATMEMRPSKNGNFVSVTATINATSKLQLDNLYRELSGHPAVLMAL